MTLAQITAILTGSRVYLHGSFAWQIVTRLSTLCAYVHICRQCSYEGQEGHLRPVLHNEQATAVP